MYANDVGSSPPPRQVGDGTQVLREGPSSHSAIPVDAAMCLQHLEEDVRRDVAAAQQRVALLQEEVDALLARVAQTRSAGAEVHGDNDPVVQRVEALRRLRRD